MPSDERLRKLALEWEEAREQGRPVTPEELCHKHGCPELLEELQRRVRVLENLAPVRGLGEPPDSPFALPSTGPMATADGATAEPAGRNTLHRYRRTHFHARGGMGEVWHAEDQELHRHVALKCIQERYRDSTDLLHRFQMEAEVTAKLEHPGIVPVFGLIHDETGQPYYAMRFVEGEPLAKAIERFHTPATGTKPDAGERSVAFRDLLNRFVAVCNTIAYAHSRGIIHRDLKPGNVMLGSYGETLLIDWGLARLFERPEAERTAQEEMLDLVEGKDRETTRPGEKKGTPAYMSPEQAEGRWEVVGKGTDIYSLGATLYVLLTGRAPFTGTTHEEIFDRVKRGEFPSPRQVRPDVPRPLEAICLKAMARRPEERYSTVRAFAVDVEHWLADEPVSAYREPLRTRARRWARKHRPLVAGLTALLLTTVLLGGGFGLWWKQQHDAMVGAVQDHLDRAEQLRDAEEWDESHKALDRAEERLAGGRPARLHERLQAMREQLELVRQLTEARMQRLGIAESNFDDAGADRMFAAVFAEQQLDPLGEDIAGTAERIARSPVRKQLAVALDVWAVVREQQRKEGAERLRAVARLADDDPWRQRLREPALREDRGELERLAAHEDVLAQPPVNLTLLSLLLYYRNASQVVVDLLRRAQQQHPSDFELTFALGGYLMSSNKEEAIAFHRAALALQPRNAIVLCNLGALLASQKRAVEAEAAFRKALAFQPQFPAVWHNLGALLASQKRAAEAEAAYRKALVFQPEFAGAWNNLGVLLADVQRLAEAEAAFREALRLKRNYAGAWANFGNLLSMQKKMAEAEAAYRTALDIEPNDPKAWNNFGLFLAGQRKPAEAEAAFRKAIARQRNFAEAWANLGNLLASLQRPAEAATAYREALAYEPKDARIWVNLGVFLASQKRAAEAEAAYREAIKHQPKFAGAWTNLGNLLADLQRPTEAEAAHREALKHEPKNATNWHNLGILLADLQRSTEAEAAYHEALDIDSNSAEVWNNLGILLAKQKRVANAEAAFLKAIAIQDHDKAWYNLGRLLLSQKRVAEAERAFRKVTDKLPDFAEGWVNLGMSLQNQKKLAEAEAVFRKAILVKPRLAGTHCNLGHILLAQGRFTEAVAHFKKGHELGSPQPGWPYPSAQWVKQAEDLVELDGKLTSVLKGDAEPANAVEQIRMAQLCQKYKQHHAAAARFYREAFAAEPRLAENLRIGNRYYAARAAALASCGQGKDVDQLDENARTRLREQALAWLQAELTAWSARLKDDPKLAAAVQPTMQHWQKDMDLASVRDANGLTTLSEDERKQWRQLWDDVETLRQRAGGLK